jgi:hypothetical protein
MSSANTHKRCYTDCIGSGGTATNVVFQGTSYTPNVQYSITAINTDGTVAIQQSQHDRVDCCLRSYWHSCTEYQVSVTRRAETNR